MSSADFNLVFFDPTTGNQIDMVDNRRIVKLQYQRKLNDVSNFSLTMFATDRMLNAGSLNTPILNTTNIIMDIYRRIDVNFEYEDSFLVKSVTLIEQNNTDFLILAGVHVLDFLAQTLVIPEDDPGNANGYITYSGQADAAMAQVVQYQCVSPTVNMDRTRSYISLSALDNTGLPVFERVQQEPVLGVLQRMTVQGVCDFTLTHQSGLDWRFYPHIVGNDFTRSSNYPGGPMKIFAPQRRNIKNTELTINRFPEKNVVYVATQGIEEDRFIGSVTSGFENLPLNRRETIIDNRNIEEDSSLATAISTAGQAEIRDKQPVIEFKFDVDTNAPGGRYQLDWVLGDKVTATYLGYEQNLRIIGVDIQIQNNEELIKPMFQEWIV